MSAMGGKLPLVTFMAAVCSRAMEFDAFTNHRIKGVILLDPSCADLMRELGKAIQSLSLGLVFLFL